MQHHLRRPGLQVLDWVDVLTHLWENGNNMHTTCTCTCNTATTYSLLRAHAHSCVRIRERGHVLNAHVGATGVPFSCRENDFAEVLVATRIVVTRLL